MSLSTRILIGMGLGIATGAVFREGVAFLKVPGDAFVMLLQMTVLPYILVSLISGLGGLSLHAAAILGRKCGLLLLVLWSIGLLTVLATPLAFPQWETASFFSSSLIEQGPAVDFLALYIPSNVFHALSSNVVPAVVVFSFALGVALIGVREKEALMKGLSTLADGLGRLTNFLVGLAPFGVFAILASATGTLRWSELQRLQVFMITYMVTSLLLTFWILPGLVISLTPAKYKDLVGPARPALLTAFATGSIFVVLPLLAERSKEILRRLDGTREEADGTVDVIITTSFSFPNLGKILTLSFVLFAGWFSNSPVPASQYPVFAISGLFSFFGDPNVAIPFLLDLLKIPTDTYRFFPAVDNLVGGRFGTLLAAMFTLVLAVLGAGAVRGLLRVQWRRLLPYAALSVALTAGALVGTRWFFESVVGHEYRGYRTFISMDLSRPYPPATIHKSPPPPPPHDPGRSRLPEIRDRGYVRVGYFQDALPFAFVNESGKLVGFDIEMAVMLAQEMNVKLELVPIDRAMAPAILDSGAVDIIMSGLAATVDNAQKMTLSTTYMDQTLAFIVKDHRREEFNSRERVKKLTGLRIGVPNVPYYAAKVRQYLPQAELVVLETPRTFFTKGKDNLDAFVYSAEAGSAWSLIYPAYTVAIPEPDILRAPMAYAVRRGDRELVDFLNVWIELKRKDRRIAELYDYWILGGGAEKNATR
jgi:Na+/H+-dicarboxylate symporter/ABC-type amino acid transport substrate-binding protein